MIKLKTILSEENISIFYCEVLVKLSKKVNKVFIYNEIRGVKDVVVVTVEKNDYLDSQASENAEYSLLKMKYIVRNTPEEDMKKIMISSKQIEGVLQFIPRTKTIKRVGQY